MRSQLDEKELQTQFQTAVLSLMTLRNMLESKPAMFREANRMGKKLGEMRRELQV